MALSLEVVEGLTKIALALRNLEPVISARISELAIGNDNLSTFPRSTAERLTAFITGHQSLVDELRYIEFLTIEEQLYYRIDDLPRDAWELFEAGITTIEQLRPLLSQSQQLSYNYYDEYSQLIRVKEYLTVREEIRHGLDEFDVIGDIEAVNVDFIPYFLLTVTGSSSEVIESVIEWLSQNEYLVTNLKTFPRGNRRDLIRIGNTVRLLITEYFSPDQFNPSQYPLLVRRGNLSPWY
jgi:hypothetical protein